MAEVDIVDFLERHYMNSFVCDIEKLKKSASEIPNKKLSESVLQALEQNRSSCSRELLESIFDINRVIKESRMDFGEAELLELFYALTKIPFEIYLQYFKKRSGLTIGVFLLFCQQENIEVHPHTVSSLEKMKKFGRGCPDFFRDYRELNDCEVGNENCHTCWTKFFSIMDEEVNKSDLNIKTPSL